MDMWSRLGPLRSDPGPDPGIDRAAVLVPLFEDAEGDVRVVITKRPMTMPTHAGHLAFPGGRPDPADKGPLETALREAEEEVGIAPESVEVLGFLDPIHTAEFSLYVVPVVGRLSGVPDLRPSPREVDKVLLPRLEDLADADSWRYETWNEHKVWFIDVGGEILWGATARMMRQVLDLP